MLILLRYALENVALPEYSSKKNISLSVNKALWSFLIMLLVTSESGTSFIAGRK